MSFLKIWRCGAVDFDLNLMEMKEILNYNSVDLAEVELIHDYNNPQSEPRSNDTELLAVRRSPGPFSKQFQFLSTRLIESLPLFPHREKYALHSIFN